MQKTTPFFYLIDKSEGMTSFDVIRQLKKRGLGGQKIGHLGTLDPFASGLLVVGVNGATKLMSYIADWPKTYEVHGVLGKKMTTGDREGEVISESALPLLEKERLIQVLSSFVGEYWQSPHAFSAAKHQGKKLYQWAREGVRIEKEKKRRYIHAINLISHTQDQIFFQVTVSSGTYIRVLFEDIAEGLQTQGFLQGLRRTRLGDHEVTKAQSLSRDLPLKKVSLNEFYPLPQITLDSHNAQFFKNGGVPSVSFPEGIVLGWVKDEEQRVLGLAEQSLDPQGLRGLLRFSN